MRAILMMMCIATAACGLGFADDSSGGAVDLPTTGAGPYHRLATDLDSPADEPWLETDRVLDQTEPELLPRDGGGFRFWFSREGAGEPAGDTQIFAGALRTLGQLPDVEPAPALVADQPWEEGHVGAPAIVVLPDRLVMFYEGGLADPQIGRADSTDGGATWQKRTAPVLADARSPGAAFDGHDWILGFVRGSAPGIWLARSSDGVAFTADDAPVLTARTAEPKAFDATEVRAPCLRWLVESSGRGHWALWFAGLKAPPEPNNAPRYAIGYAASFDGIGWQRSAGGRPVMAAPAGAPATLVDGPDALLLFDAVNGLRPSVGIATYP